MLDRDLEVVGERVPQRGVEARLFWRSRASRWNSFPYEFLLCTWLLVLPLVMPSGESRAADSKQEQIARWVAQLSDDRYAVREAATNLLVSAGAAAIDDVARAIVGGDLETIARGIFVLRELSLSEEVNTEIAARSSLEEIADAQLTSAATRAAAALRNLNELRQEKAIDELNKLGAKVDRHVDLEQTLESFAVEISSEAWKGSDEDLGRLRFLVDASHVELSGDKVTDQWLASIKAMPRLTSLSIKRGKISAAGLHVLAEASELQELTIHFSPITDDAIPHFKRIEKLALLKLYGSRISKAGEARLRETLAHAELDFRQGGLLGIAGTDAVWGAACEVQFVAPGSAAEQAGLQIGDVIMKYNDQAVTTFRDLTDKIAKHAPGKKVSLTIQRGNDVMQRDVTLGAWQ